MKLKPFKLKKDQCIYYPDGYYIKIVTRYRVNLRHLYYQVRHYTKDGDAFLGSMPNYKEEDLLKWIKNGEISLTKPGVFNAN